MRRLKLHPIDAACGFVKAQPPQQFIHAAVNCVAGVALRHNDEITIDLILGVHRYTIARRRTVAAVLVKEGQKVPVGATLAVIAVEGEDPAEVKKSAGSASAGSSAEAKGEAVA